MRRCHAGALWLSCALVLVLYRSAAASPRRMALVVGNATYAQAPMRTPVNDATDMATTLTQLGFEVSLLHNAPRQALEEALVGFGAQLRQSEIGLFFSAGRGIHVQDQHYLLPIGAPITGVQDLQERALSLRHILAVVAAASPVPAILVLATSRDNPFGQNRPPRPPGLVGLAQRNVLIAYATSPGRVALEGAGRHSLYTKHLLQQLPTPGLRLTQLFRAVRLAVEQESQGQQIPWELSLLHEDISCVRKLE